MARGQPYFCKHLYAIHAAQRNLTTPDQILECCKHISPSLTPYLANIFQIQNPRENFGHSQLNVVQKLFAQSHEATDAELHLAKQGKLLKQLHQTNDVEKFAFTGTPAKRALHNGGKRRVGGPVKNSKYSLMEPDVTAQDPYSPKVQFPSTAQERHCGRKRARTTTRELSMENLKIKPIHIGV